MALAAGFKFSEATHDEMGEVWKVLLEAYAPDEQWTIMLKDVKPEEVEPWFVGSFAPRWMLPDITTYVIKEEETGKIVAWTALQFPWKIRPITDEMKAMVNSHELPPGPDGMNMGALAEVAGMLGICNQFGYDPDNDYHRKGTMVLPAFQKKRFGTFLTRHCNAISDKDRRKTFVPARSTSIKMFLANGFKEIGQHDAHLERWGGSREGSITWAVVRDPVSK